MCIVLCIRTFQLIVQKKCTAKLGHTVNEIITIKKKIGIDSFFSVQRTPMNYDCDDMVEKGLNYMVIRAVHHQSSPPVIKV